METQEMEIQLRKYKDISHARSVENKRINKRNKELERSRNSWKSKSMLHKERADKLEMELQKIKKKVSEII